MKVKKGLRIINKSCIQEENYWKVSASHDGYLKKYNSIHERKIEFFPDKGKLAWMREQIEKIECRRTYRY